MIMVSDSIQSLYETALDAGIKPHEFYDYSPGEVIDLIESANRARIEDTRRRVSEMFMKAEVMRLYLFPPEGSELPQPWDYYPELFEQEKEAFLQQKGEKDLEVLKRNRLAYYKEFNDRIGQQ